MHNPCHETRADRHLNYSEQVAAEELLPKLKELAA
jgi:hypothetical protein